MASDEVHLITYRMALASEGIVGECLFLAYSVESVPTAHFQQNRPKDDPGVANFSVR